MLFGVSEWAEFIKADVDRAPGEGLPVCIKYMPTQLCLTLL